MKPSTVIKFWGSQAKAGKALGVSQQAVSHWVKLGEVPKRWVPYARLLMKGKRK